MDGLASVFLPGLDCDAVYRLLLSRDSIGLNEGESQREKCEGESSKAKYAMPPCKLVHSFVKLPRLERLFGP